MTQKILIVEDDMIIQMFLEQVVTNLGCHIVGVADNSDDSLRLIAKYSPDIVFMDVGINGSTDGIETAQIIKDQFEIPVIFITGNSDKPTIERMKKADPVHIIQKPIDEFALISQFDLICKKLNIPFT